MSRIYENAVNEELMERNYNALPRPSEHRKIDIIATKLQEDQKDQRSKTLGSPQKDEVRQQLFNSIGVKGHPATRNLEHRDLIQSDFSTRGHNMLQFNIQHRVFSRQRPEEEEEYLQGRSRSPTSSYPVEIQHPMSQSFSPEHQTDYEENSNNRRRYEDEASELEDLEHFAKDFKQKRIKMGFTQGDVGIAMGKFYGNDFSQTTISRFEALNLSVKNMCKLKPLLERWLVDVDRAIATGDRGEGRMSLSPPVLPMPLQQGGPRKRKKRTSIPTEGKSRLEDAFGKNPKPTSEEICKFSEDLKMDREVIRVWFCNRRQKQKRIATQQQHYLGDEEHSPTSHSVGGESSPDPSGDESCVPHQPIPRNYDLTRRDVISNGPPGIGQSTRGLSQNRPGIIQLNMSDRFSPFNGTQGFPSNLAMGGKSTS